MQELTDEKIIADFKISNGSPTAEQEIEDIRQGVANAVVTRIAMSELTEEQTERIAEMSEGDPEKIQSWLREQGIDVEAVFKEVYEEHLDNFNLLSQ